ncbi:MAG: PIN domain-containing protein [Hyphomicrobium aestuarii]|nr:PIN domain-containing protein [Hyphomicrobium aestuarii]
MTSAPAVFVDTNVLVSTMLRNIFLELAAAGAIRIHWSAEVLEELRATHQKLRPGILAADIDLRERAMNATFPEALVLLDARKAPVATLPDPKDVHVLAAALAVPCDFIVTFNLKHFPTAELTREATRIHATHPDALLLTLITTAPEPTLSARFAAQHTFKAPPLNDDAFQALLAKIGLPQTANLLRHLGQA